MTEIGIVNNRKIFYQDYNTGPTWGNAFSTKNWLALIITPSNNKAELIEIAKNVICDNVCYVSCVGEHAELLHDILDEEIVFRQINAGENHLLSSNIITTWHIEIDEALWFSVYTANNNPALIEHVVCLNCSEEELLNELKTLFKRFELGYIPH